MHSNAVLSKETMDAESSEVLGLWEGEFGEGRRDSECSESGESGAVTYSEPEGSLYIPTPDRPRTVVCPIDLRARLCFIELSQLGSFVSTVNQIRTCTTSGCKGNLALVAVNCRGLGGAVTGREGGREGGRGGGRGEGGGGGEREICSSLLTTNLKH